MELLFQFLILIEKHLLVYYKLKRLLANAVAQVLNTFSGGGNNSFGLLSLGILPYINASIIIQLLTTAIPSLSKMQKEEGEYGRTKNNRLCSLFNFFLGYC